MRETKIVIFKKIQKPMLTFWKHIKWINAESTTKMIEQKFEKTKTKINISKGKSK